MADDLHKPNDLYEALSVPGDDPPEVRAFEQPPTDQLPSGDDLLNAVASRADVVILLSCILAGANLPGAGGVAFIDGKAVPLEVKIDYGEDDDPALTIRRVEVTAGYTRAEWLQRKRGN